MNATKKSAMFLSLILAMAFGSLVLTACNTTKGAGEDIESVGEAISDAADD